MHFIFGFNRKLFSGIYHNKKIDTTYLEMAMASLYDELVQRACTEKGYSREKAELYIYELTKKTRKILKE